MFERKYTDNEILIRISETSGAHKDSWTDEIWSHGYRHTVGFGEELRRCYAEIELLQNKLESAQQMMLDDEERLIKKSEEIERQRALIERARDLFGHTELCTDETCKNYQCADYKQWLKDAGVVDV